METLQSQHCLFHRVVKRFSHICNAANIVEKETHANTLSCSDAETPKKENTWRSWQEFRAEIRERRRHLWCQWCALIWTNWLLHHRIHRRMLAVLTASNTQIYPLSSRKPYLWDILQTKSQNKTLSLFFFQLFDEKPAGAAVTEAIQPGSTMATRKQSETPLSLCQTSWRFSLQLEPRNQCLAH